MFSTAKVIRQLTLLSSKCQCLLPKQILTFKTISRENTVQIATISARLTSKWYQNIHKQVSIWRPLLGSLTFSGEVLLFQQKEPEQQSNIDIPQANRRVIVTTLNGNSFRAATKIQSSRMPKPGPGEVLVKNRFVGVNLYDVYTYGGLGPNSPPFVAGLESIGEIAAVGADVSLKVGQAVVVVHHGSFAEYVSVPIDKVMSVPAVAPGLMSIVNNGLTASISLSKEADLQPGKTVLVTAAAGEPEQFAVQLAKLAGCHVIGTCSTAENCEFLKSIGCDRVINYINEDVGSVLSKEYPDGIDVVYESMGKEMFNVALKNLAVKGRMILVGQMGRYDLKDQNEKCSQFPVSLAVLQKSASVRGFFLLHYLADVPEHITKLMNLYAEGKLKVMLDNGENSSSGPFKKLETIVDAVEHLHLGKNVGKVIVEV